MVSAPGSAALPASVVGVASGPIADGARVFYDKGCEYCHIVSGYGGIRGPDLSDAGDRMSSLRWPPGSLAEPRTCRPTAGT